VAERERKVLVEEVLEELGHAQIGPAPVYQQETLEVAELSHREVTGEYRLHSLLTTDTHADVRRCITEQLIHKVIWEERVAVPLLQWDAPNSSLPLRRSSPPSNTPIPRPTPLINPNGIRI